MVVREGSWQSQSVASASGGSYLYSSGSEQDVLVLPFQGTTIEIIYVAGPNLGTLALEVDGTVLRTVITTADHTAYHQSTVINYLADETHTLRVYAQEGGVVAVDAFVIKLPIEDSLTGGARVVVPPDDPAYQITYDNGSASDVFIAYTSATPLQLTSTGDKHSPVWSPTGTRIAYVTYREPSGEAALGMIERNDQGQWTDRGVFAYLTNDYLIYGKIAWSPDGTRIAYAADNQGDVALYYLDLTNCTLVNNYPTQCTSVAITQFSYGINDHNPSWSPDGTRIVFQTNRDGCCHTHLYTIRPDGTNLTRISYAGYTGGELPGSTESLLEPEWSPDGTQLTVIWYGRLAPGDTEGRLGDIATINVDGTNLTRLTDTPEQESSPTWSPDGSQIAFARGLWSSAQLYRINVSTLQTTLQGAGRNPKWRRQPTPPHCIVEVNNGQNFVTWLGGEDHGSVTIDGFSRAFPARTNRFEGTPTEDDFVQQFVGGTRLQLDYRYSRQGQEEAVYIVSAYLEPGASEYTPLNPPLYISTAGVRRASYEAYYPSVIPVPSIANNDCQILPDYPNGAGNLSAEEALIEEIRDYQVDVRACGSISWDLQELQGLLDGLERIVEAFGLESVRVPVLRTVFLLNDDPNATNPVIAPDQNGNSTVPQVYAQQRYDIPEYILFIRLLGNRCADEPLTMGYNENETDYDNLPTSQGGTTALGNECLASPGNNLSTVSFVNARPATIVCRGDNWTFSQYTAVHELGHIFDQRIQRSVVQIVNNNITPIGRLTDRVQNHLIGYDLDEQPNNTTIPRSLRDCGFGANGIRLINTPNASLRTINIVMGVDDGWTRGLNGWGTYGNGITNFQQNPEDTPYEAAADMFLNWVYRRTSLGSAIPNGNLPGEACTNNVAIGDGNTPPGSATWEGFRNITTTGGYDSDLPGNRRYWWMEREMNDVITALHWR